MPASGAVRLPLRLDSRHVFDHIPDMPNREFFRIIVIVKPFNQRIPINQAHHLSPPANPPATAIAKVKITKSSDG
jgi:hypothetical protein